HFIVNADTIRKLAGKAGKIIPVGTTSLRTLESIYWIGLKILTNKIPEDSHPVISQWEAYELQGTVPAADSLLALAEWLESKGESTLRASTSLLIAPGYRFRLTGGLVTNFHQPRSTLLLLVSAWTGEKWTDVYRYAVEKKFRFLSYGDSSLLLK
ncbi:MAG: S-adenosylmethionine:tRNA ribosyltransferase-isomerase, partial [Bacteroidales bacterium]|nr:S-adenosylmethionine:tRNA ribosyltransferase-isomerase [Bacteroidales bacterium]